MRGRRRRDPHRLSRGTEANNENDAEPRRLETRLGPRVWWNLVVTIDEATGEVYSGFFVAVEGAWSSFRGALETVRRRGSSTAGTCGRGWTCASTAMAACRSSTSAANLVDTIRARSCWNRAQAAARHRSGQRYRLHSRSWAVTFATRQDPRSTDRSGRGLQHRRHKRRWDSVNMRNIWKWERAAQPGGALRPHGPDWVVKRNGSRGKWIWLSARHRSMAGYGHINGPSLGRGNRSGGIQEGIAR